LGLVCSNCGQKYKELPKVAYHDGSGGIMWGNAGCDCGSGRDAIKEE